MESHVNLGSTYIDLATRFRGVATSRHEKLFGHVIIGLEGLDKDGLPITSWFDQERLEMASEGPLQQASMIESGRSASTV